MMKTTNHYSPEFQKRAGGMIYDHQDESGTQETGIHSLARRLDCSTETMPKNVRQKLGLYEHIGGETAIQAIADHLLRRLLADYPLNTWLDHAELEVVLNRLKWGLTIVFRAGGRPEQGKGLREQFRSTLYPKITDDQLDWVLGHFYATCEIISVPAPELEKLKEWLDVSNLLQT